MKKWIVFLGLAFLCPAAFAQEDFIPPKSGGFVSIGCSYQQWTAEEDDESLNQTVMPVTCFYPVSPQWFLNISNSPASASYASYSISGLSDTWIRTTYVTRNERLMFNLGVGLPTGQTELDEEEFALTMMLSENVLKYRLPAYGQGFAVKAGAGTAFPMQSGAVLGLGFNYILKQPYDLWAGVESEYDPGDEINVVAGLSMPVGGKQGKWSTDLIYSVYGSDEINGVEFMDAGDKILLSTSLAYKLKSGFFYGAVRYRQRGKNELFPGPDSGTEESVSKKTIGDQIETDGLWEFKRWSKGGLSLLWDGRFYGENEDEYGSSTVYGLGVGLQQSLSPKVSLKIQVKILTGTMQMVTDIPGIGAPVVSDIDINGIDFLAGIKVNI